MAGRFLVLVVLISFVSVTQAQETQITYGYWDANQTETIAEQIKVFEEMHPDITVEPQLFPWTEYFTRLQTGVAGGSAFDVFWINGPNFPVYASQGVLMSLEELVSSGQIEPNLYPQALIEAYSYNGELYGVPKEFDTIALYYNKAMFDAAGIEYPSEDWTWQDLRGAAEKLTIRDGSRVAQYGMTAHTLAQQGWANFVFQNGGRVLSEDGSSVVLDEPAACEALLFVYDFVADGLAPDGAVLTAEGWEPAVNQFPAGRIAMTPGGSWLATFLHGANPDIGIAPLPRGEQQASIIHGVANVVWSGSRSKEAATTFVAFLASRSAQEIVAEYGQVIPAMDGLQEAWVQAIPESNRQVFIDAVDYSVPLPSMTTDKGTEWETRVDQTLRDAWLGNIPRDQICQRVTEEGNAALER